KTAGRDWPSEAEAMRRYLARRFPGIPGAAIRLEDASLDTADNARMVAALLRASAPLPLTLLTVGVHLPRSLTLFRTFGVAVERGLAAEDVLAERSPRHRAFLLKYTKSPRVAAERLKEALLRLLLVVDPTAVIPGLLTKRWRG
ncbi:MAG: YdcF family protein, partial [Nitrospirae bacterium]